MPDCIWKGSGRSYVCALSDATGIFFIWLCPDTIDYTYKSAHREELNALYAQKGMADDILIVRNGYLTDTSISNIALL